jgi:predicted small lipoprotein YifL
MSTRNVAIVLSLLLAGLVSGCGQKGPLYLPGSPSEVQSVTQQPPQQQAPAEEDDDEDRVPNR